MPCASRSPMPSSRITLEKASLMRATSACLSGGVMLSARNQPAIHVVRLSRDVVGLGARKEYRHPGDIVRGFRAPHRDIPCSLLPHRAKRALFMLAPLAVNLFPHVGSNRPGANAVYRQVWRKFHGGSLGDIDRSGLAGGIGTQHRPAAAPGDRRNVDYFAARAPGSKRRLPKHLARARLKREKKPARID